MITAVLGTLIFSERLPGLWWLGASLLVAGSVIIGRRDEGSKENDDGTASAEPLVPAGDDQTGSESDRFTDEPDQPELGDLESEDGKPILELRNVSNEGSK